MIKKSMLLSAIVAYVSIFSAWSFAQGADDNTLDNSINFENSTENIYDSYGHTENFFNLDRGEQRVSIECSSSGYKYKACPVEGRIKVANLIRQISRSSCTYGVSWGYQDNNVWVDKGCKGVFDVVVHSRRHQPEYEDLACNSSGFKYSSCMPTTLRTITRVDFLSRSSRSTCDFGTSWGYDPYHVWVDKGCKANFRIYGY